MSCLMNLTGLPRKAFDVVEQPVANASEALLETDAFMDLLALGWKVQRRALKGMAHGTAAALRMAGVPNRAELLNEIGALQRELRALRREFEAR
jgi:hypothetical protein